LLLLAFSGPTTAYISGLPLRQPRVEKTLSKDDQSSRIPTSNNKNVSYDLGLGKNLPLYNQQRPAFVPSSTYQATEHLVEHHAVIQRQDYFRPEPHKFHNAATPESSAVVSAAPLQQHKSKRISKGPVLGHRITDDSVLRITSGQAHGNNLKSRYDLNTAWVEMLIYSEQQRAAAASA